MDWPGCCHPQSGCSGGVHLWLLRTHTHKQIDLNYEATWLRFYPHPEKGFGQHRKAHSYHRSWTTCVLRSPLPPSTASQLCRTEKNKWAPPLNVFFLNCVAPAHILVTPIRTNQQTRPYLMLQAKWQKDVSEDAPCWFKWIVHVQKDEKKAVWFSQAGVGPHASQWEKKTLPDGKPKGRGRWRVTR